MGRRVYGREIAALSKTLLVSNVLGEKAIITALRWMLFWFWSLKQTVFDATGSTIIIQ